MLSIALVFKIFSTMALIEMSPIPKLWVFLALAIAIPSRTLGQLTPEQQQAIDVLIARDFMAFNKIPGLGLGIVSGNQSWVKGYGFMSMEPLIPADQGTKFCIASVSKTFAATIVVKVLSETFPEFGSAVLDIPIRQLHPNGNFTTFSDRYRSEYVTFRDILSHRVSVETESLGSSAGAFADLDEMVYRIRYAKEFGPFRATGYYSNTGYVLMGKLIGEIAGVPYTTLLENLMTNIGMTQSTYVKKDVDYDSLLGMSKGFYMKDDQVLTLNSSLINRIFLGTPGGGIISTAQDMAKYMAFHLNLGNVDGNQIIPQEVMLWLRQPTIPIDAMTFKSPTSERIIGSYGLGTGFQLGVVDGYATLSHTGQYVTFMSDMRLYPDLNLGIFTTNNGPVNLHNSERDYNFLHTAIFDIIMNTTGKARTRTIPKTQNAFIRQNKKISARKPAPIQMNQSQFPGIYGHPVEGELEILDTTGNPAGPLYMRYGSWATGFLTEYPSLPNSYLMNWDTDLEQEIYFGAGGPAETIVEFLEDGETLNLDIGRAMNFDFRRNVTLDGLPETPWDDGSCGPEGKKGEL